MHDKTLLVFPTSRAIREYISNLRETNSFLPHLVSIGNFFQKAIFTPNKKQISDELKTIYLQQVVQDIDIKALGISSDFSSFLKHSVYIIRFFNELASEFKTIEDLDGADTYAHYLDHLNILQNIQKNYHNLLKENGYIDKSLLPYNYKINEDYIKQFNDIKIIHEGIFSKFESEVVEKISKLTNVHIHKKGNQELKDYDVDIAPVGQKILQVAFIKQKIYEMVTIQKIDPSKIAVVLPDESFHTMLALFDDEKYFNFAMGNNINNSNIKKTVKTISKLLTNYEPRDKDKLERFNINQELFYNLIQPNWNHIVSKELFINIYDQLVLCEPNKDIVEKLNELKISLTILFFTQNLDLKLKDMFKVIQNKLNDITLDDTRGGKITVLGLLETRAVQYDGVIVCDFNDDKVPKRSIKDKFLSTSVKEFAGLPTSKNREDLQKYYYKNLFDGAKKIAICYVADEVSVKSRFINEIFPNYKHHNQAYDCSKILYQTQSINRFQKDIVINIDLSQKTWSATSLKIYLECKRRYYFNYIAKIKEHNISLKPDGYELGKIIHTVLEHFMTSNNLEKTNLYNMISNYQQKNPYLTMELEVWKRKLQKFIDYEKQRDNKGYKVFAVEQPFTFDYNGIMLKGTIDRIDSLGDGKYEILDYKTSNSLKVDTIKTYEKSNDFQLEFYALSQKNKVIENIGYYDLNSATIKSEIMLDEKIKLLDKKLEELKTTQVNFTLCENKTQCTYCPYKIMCGRE
jgi:CRISPR/Cas system-associated exonuclease Cas4 (RecB family)